MNEQPERRSRWQLPAYCILPVAVLLTIAWLQRPDQRLHVFFLNTPGDAVLVQTPAGEYVLIDGGSDPALLALLLGRQLPFWRRDLRAIILTRSDGGSAGSQVAALSRYRVRLALSPPGLAQYGAGGEWRRLVSSPDTAARQLQSGQRLDLGAGVRIRVLGVAEGKVGGAVLIIEYGATRVLLHNGGPAGDEAASQAAAHPIDLLAYPWQRPLDTSLIAALRPRSIVFSTGYEELAPALLSYTDRRRYSPALFHEKNDGTVELISTGRKAWLIPMQDTK